MMCEARTLAGLVLLLLGAVAGVVHQVGDLLLWTSIRHRHERQRSDDRGHRQDNRHSCSVEPCCEERIC